MGSQDNKKFSAALITGASRGIGAELAKLAARDCRQVVLVARSVSALEQVAEELETKYGCQTFVISCDLSAAGSVSGLVEKIDDLGVSVNVLVNCAGFGYDARFVESDFVRQQSLVQTNCEALMELCHIYGARMAKAGKGQILNVASIAGFMPGPLMATYYASKAFVQSFTQALHVELKGSGVHVSALCPGPVRTEFWNSADAGHTALAHMALPATYVARVGWAALNVNKATCMPGVLAKVIVFSTRILPRPVIARMAALLQYKKR